jgi:cyclase
MMKRPLLMLIAACALLVSAAGPVAADVDLSGNWAPLYHEEFPERIPGPEIGDYLGLPLTDAARAKAHAWSASLLTLPEHQCKPHPVGYGFRGPSNMRIQQEVDRQTQAIVKITIYLMWMQQYREVWMDGRPHPPAYAPHTWQGFSTGRWDGDTLVVTTSHMKAGWVRRNGIVYSDRATFTDRWVRHGNLLTHVAILEDPLNLTEPFIRTTNWQLALNQVIDPYPCVAVDEIAGRRLGEVPHYLPGTNPMLAEFATRHGLMTDWTEGGAHTAYPEYIAAMKTGRVARPLAPQRIAASAAAPAGARPDIEIYPVQGNVSVLVGAGSNVVVQSGSDGLLVVNTGIEAMSDTLLSAVRRMAAGMPIRYIINTSADSDITGGNATLGGAGQTVAGGDIRQALGNTGGDGATILAHEAVQVRMARSRPFNAWPTETFFTAKKELFFNGEGIQILHAPSAHADGDVMVYFRKSDVLVVGELFTTDSFPVIRTDEGGSINGVVTALNRIIDMAIPREKQEGGTYVVPARGRIVDEAEIVDYRDMVTIVRDRVADLVDKNNSLEQVLAARPTFEYDGRWAAPAGEATAAGFVTAAFRTIAIPPAVTP